MISPPPTAGMTRAPAMIDSGSARSRSTSARSTTQWPGVLQRMARSSSSLLTGVGAGGPVSICTFSVLSEIPCFASALCAARRQSFAGATSTRRSRKCDGTRYRTHSLRAMSSTSSRTVIAPVGIAPTRSFMRHRSASPPTTTSCANNAAAITALMWPRSSSDRVVQRDRLAAPLYLHRQVAGVAQLGVETERRVGRGHLAAVDGLDGVAVLQPDAPEDRLRTDRVQLEAVGLAVLDRRHEARRRRQHGRVREQLLDERAIDGARVAAAVDALVDVAELGVERRRRRRVLRDRRRRRDVAVELEVLRLAAVEDVDALGHHAIHRRARPADGRPAMIHLRVLLLRRHVADDGHR